MNVWINGSTYYLGGKPVSKVRYKWERLKSKLRKWWKRYQVIDTRKYAIYLKTDGDRAFWLSKSEYEQAKYLERAKGNLEYCFSNTTGIGITLRVKVIETGEIIDITDYSTW